MSLSDRIRRMIEVRNERIRKMLAKGMSQVEIARRERVSKQRISQIVKALQQ